MLAVNDTITPAAAPLFTVTEQLGGMGDVFEKESRQYIGTFPYLASITPPTVDDSGAIEAAIGLDRDYAARANANQTPLVLRMQDGRCFDFLVTLPMWGPAVAAAVRPISGLRDAW